MSHERRSAPRSPAPGWVRGRSVLALLAGAALVASAWPAAGFAAESDERRDLRLGTVAAEVALAAAAEAWAFDLVLDPALDRTELRVDLERVTCEEALDLLTAPARSFWWEGPDGAVHVAPATPTKRREAGRSVRRLYRLERADPQDVTSALRTLASAYPIAIGEGRAEVELWEAVVPHADQIVAMMEAEHSSGWSVHWVSLETRIAGRAIDPRLGTEGRQRLWFPQPTPVARLHQAIEAAWDVDLVLEPGIVSPGVARLRLANATLFEALDAVTLPAGHFWTSLGGRRILIAESRPRQHRLWGPTGLAAFPLRRADPLRVRRLLRDLEVRFAFVASTPPLVLVRESPVHLAVVELVVETLEGEGLLAAPAGGRLWLGPLSFPRSTEAQLLVDPATPEERRRALAAAAPPSLAPGPEAATEAEAGSRFVPAIGVLEDELGLNVGLHPCCGIEEATLRLMTIDRRVATNRPSAARYLDGDRAGLLTVIGPETVLLAPAGDYPRRMDSHWGVAAIPLGADRSAVAALADELKVEAAWWTGPPGAFLFATGRWEDLGALLDAAAGTLTGPAGGLASYTTFGTMPPVACHSASSSSTGIGRARW